MDDAGFREAIREAHEAGQREDIRTLRDILDVVGAETVAWLRSHTAGLRPPAKAGEPDRRAHPGGWADVTGQLAASYDHTVRQNNAHTVTLTLSNAAEYAVYLEARDGYFVLSGAVEPGGPVDRFLRGRLSAILPHWKVDIA